MNLIFTENKKRNWNTLNENSIQLKYTDIDRIEDFEDVIFLDDDNNKILDTSLYLPENKAYTIFNRVHFGELYKNNKKDAMKQFLNYLFFPNHLKHLTSAIYFRVEEAGISDDVAEEAVFLPICLGSPILMSLNKNFEQTIADIPLSSEVKDSVLQNYKLLENKNNNYLKTIRHNLEEAKLHLNYFKEKNDTTMIQAKEIEIRHYEEILGTRPENEIHKE